jgi:hypothetical protein
MVLDSCSVKTQQRTLFPSRVARAPQSANKEIMLEPPATDVLIPAMLDAPPSGAKMCMQLLTKVNSTNMKKTMTAIL